MSGRLYDFLEGVPICPECGGDALRSDERNFNGNYCPKCKKEVFCSESTTNHPTWIAWKNWKHENWKKDKFIDISYTYKKFKKEHGFSS